MARRLIARLEEGRKPSNFERYMIIFVCKRVELRQLFIGNRFDECVAALTQTPTFWRRWQGFNRMLTCDGILSVQAGIFVVFKKSYFSHTSFVFNVLYITTLLSTITTTYLYTSLANSPFTFNLYF